MSDNKTNKIKGLFQKVVIKIRSLVRSYLYIKYKRSRFFAIAHDEIIEVMRHGGQFEQKETEFILKYLRLGDVFWDLGANFGLYSILASQRIGKKGYILAIEPDPRNRLRLWINILLNSSWNIRVIGNALGDSVSEVDYVSCFQGAYSGLKVGNVPGNTKIIKVQQTTLDKVDDQFKFPHVNLLKMDVEGAELLIIRGGDLFFSRKPQPVVICEFSDRRTASFNHKAMDVYHALEQKNYRWFRLAHDGSVIHQPPQDYFDYDNLVAIPEDQLNELSNRVNFIPNLDGDRDVEWGFIAARLGRFSINESAILDFGCGLGRLSIASASVAGKILAIDLMPVQFQTGFNNIEFQQINVMDLDEAQWQFDLVINCSTIEHVGLGGRYNMIEDESGDIKAMQKLKTLLKPSGRMLLTLPVGKDAVIAPLHRIYGAKRLPQLLEGFRIEEKIFLMKDERNVWMPCTEAEALAEEGSNHYYALGMMVLRHEQFGI